MNKNIDTHHEGVIVWIMHQAFAQKRPLSTIRRFPFSSTLPVSMTWYTYAILSLDDFPQYMVLLLNTVRGLTPLIHSFLQQVSCMSLKILPRLHFFAAFPVVCPSAENTNILQLNKKNMLLSYW